MLTDFCLFNWTTLHLTGLNEANIIYGASGIATARTEGDGSDGDSIDGEEPSAAVVLGPILEFWSDENLETP